MNILLMPEYSMIKADPFGPASLIFAKYKVIDESELEFEPHPDVHGSQLIDQVLHDVRDSHQTAIIRVAICADSVQIEHLVQ